jgi:cytoskeletal protein RodZ
MDPIRKRELKRQAFMRLAAQRRRAGLLRGRVVVVSLICFAVLWGIVFVQMATGNDPVLSAKRAVATSASSASRRKVAKPQAREVEAEPEPEIVEEEVQGEPIEAEPELEEPEVVEEPLVTSQS